MGPTGVHDQASRGKSVVPYSLKSDTWAGASSSEAYPIMQCVMVSEDATGADPDNEVVNVTTSGESACLPFQAGGTLRAINLGQAWRTNTLATFQTGYGTPSFTLSGWIVDTPDRYPSFVPNDGLSIFAASNQISAPAGNSGYYFTFGGSSGGYGGLGWNATGNPHIISYSAARLTGPTAIPFGTTKASLGIAWSRNDATGQDSSIWANVGDGEITAPGAFDITAATSGQTPDAPHQIGGASGTAGCPGEHFIHVAFNAMLNAEDFKLLHNSFFSELIAGAAPGGSVVPALRANPRIILL